MRRICVFCGSSPGARPEYLDAAVHLGHTLARNNIGLVYGGARVGIMGRVAESVLEKGGDVIGVIPKALVEKEVAFTGLADLRVVDSMHDRKALMADLADGFIALPGGLGTIEEFFEVVTWAQLGIHSKPCGLLNINQYFRKLMDFLDHTVTERFVEREHRSMVLMDDDPERLLRKFEAYQPPLTDKAQWVLRFSQAET
ncbi:MAG TPA: TIGR00730 family Rossman fold protein [Geobacteraceae bacterium]|nr:TIGR00730 family Rossman fold protein [Geobacteraceae bacterium]